MIPNNFLDAEKISAISQSLNLQSLEELRLKVVHRQRVALFVLLGAVVLCVGWGFLAIPYLGFAILGAVLGSLLYYLIAVNPQQSKFGKRFKEEVTRILLDTILPGVTYLPESHVPINYYNNSQLYRTPYDRFSGKNLVSGMVGQTRLSFSELHTEYKRVETTKNGGTRTTWHTIFNGIFMVADSNKNFDGRTYILVDTAERSFGRRIGKWLQRNTAYTRGGELVYMENPEFEKYFAVYSTNAVEARYLITPQFQERMINLRKHVRVEVEASFSGDNLYIAIHKPQDLFKYQLKRSLLDAETIELYASEIIDLLMIVEMLDLNTRIWGKE